ncbi:hypothetical protein F5Y01DRAFT_318465 [Xylaria sp. FL0043]|nr:hypothetical protein F5Y01DRAFT_318465 [Xylaria sp. FL0043]
MSSRNVKRDLLGLVFNHLVLPPEVPGAQDSEIETVSRNVLMRMIHANETAMSLACDVPWLEAYQNLQESFQACLELNRGHLERNSLLQHFRKLQPGHMLILYLNEQNAGLLVRCDGSGDGKSVIFESFEASACASSVLAAGHALQWDFPGRSARISLENFTKESFQQSLATFLEQASMESLYSLQASAQKAGASVVEIRDTADPALITQMLMSLLEAVGSYYQAPVLRKHIRDDVNIASGNIPWRRLPFWQVLRVAAQRQLCFALGAERGLISYKFLLAIVLAELLDDSAPHLSPDRVVCLRSKLARRMAKLEMLQEKAQVRGEAACHNWCIAASTIVRKSIENANMKMEVAWDSFKRKNTRCVLPLPYYRAPPDSLNLTLPNSGSHLDRILSMKLLQPSTLGPITLPNPLGQNIQRSQQFTDCAFDLAALEEQIEKDACIPLRLNRDRADRCIELEEQIRKMMGRFENISRSRGICSTYDSSPELKSATILAIFTLWTELDKAAIENCQLLADHAPVFHPELLDALQLPTKPAIERLQKIQEHLAERHARSIYGTMLETHDQDSFALRYIASSRHLQSLEDRIGADYQNARERKKEEHQILCAQYDEHTEGIAQNCCLCTFEDGDWIRTSCTKHWHMRVRRRLNIRVQEAFLPKSNPARGTIVFELGIPDWLSAYRDATWQIMSTMAHPHRLPNAEKPEIHLQECEPLSGFMEAEVNRLSLASKIKCFEQTHYNFSEGKAPLSRVLLPFAANFQLYDSVSNLWVADLGRPLTLEHHCGIQIPSSLQPILPKHFHPPTVVDGPSSYEIQANQVVAPKDTPLQAFSACQKLLAGKRRRWPNLLVELSSSNLNFSDEDTMRLMCQLASQAGPRLPRESLRAVHEIFRYSIFTNRLFKILENMLESIGKNWREHNVMQLVITLALRLHYLSGESPVTKILLTARKHLMNWISELRNKAQDTQDSTEAQRYATYGLYAALLCRSTFAILRDQKKQFSDNDLREWTQASLAVQENMLHDISKLPDTLRDLLFRDAKMVYHLQAHLKRAMETYRSIVSTEITRGSSHFPDDQTGYTTWAFLPEPQSRWIVATTPGPFPERLHFNYFEGHLLVNGKPRSKLPLSIADDEAVKFIFSDQHLITYPSNRPGMSHRLARPRKGNQVHFGLRDECAVIRTIKYNKTSGKEEILEFIPQSKLRNQSGSFDLPVELISNCGHWLNISTRCLEIRRATPESAAFWVTRPSDWIIDVPERRAIRGLSGSQLVDPQSNVFSQIADIFCGFERPDRLTVFQPQSTKASLRVELKHLDLHFEVNQKRLLYCQQLHSEIDTNQDAGTWYGLRSKIVMKEIQTGSRSIIVPLGKPIARRNDLHVDVHIQESSDYARFMIDTIIGRLTCNPEPRLIYVKALYHALTSFCLPDTLTGRTGASEAFSILRSGTAQPWTSVFKAGNQILEEFDKLVPRREYLPPNIKRIQKVIWNPDLTSPIQCDGYRQAIEAIKEKSNNLDAFTTVVGFQSTDISHLCCRGRAQRGIYDPLLDPETSQQFDRTVYVPRDRRTGAEAAQVFEASRVILSHCSQFHMSRTLGSILESFEIIGGFSTLDVDTHMSNTTPLINEIEDPVNERWGELVNFCRHTKDEASLLFRLGLVAFYHNANMDIIHSLAAISLVDEIRDLAPPQNQHFADFRCRGRPSVDLLESLIKSAYPKFQPWINKQGREMWYDENNRNATQHVEACEKEGKKLAKHIQKYWPISASDVTMELLRPAPNECRTGFPQLLLDVGSAWDKIQPEWERRRANWELGSYIMQVDDVLNSLSRIRDTTALAPWAETGPDFAVTQRSLSYLPIVQDWSAKRGPVLGVAHSSIPGIIQMHQKNEDHQLSAPDSFAELKELRKILQTFEVTNNHLRKQYVEDLYQSLTALEMRARQPERQISVIDSSFAIVNEALRHTQSRAKDIWTSITIASTADDNRTGWLKLGAIKPLSTATELLKLLRSTNSLHFGSGMKEAIVSYGIAITDIQHLFRIRRALSQRKNQALQNELREAGHKNWDPVKVPEWLLLEIDSNLLIRSEQVTVARAIIDPTLGNGVLQLSMGKGKYRKTSCIIPMVAAFLADGQSLSRVIVPKALILQTAQTMQSRLGDLVGREVTHIPFSRRTPTGPNILKLYDGIHRETQQRRGIILTCAEHLLSYKLFGWQKLLDSKNATADRMIGFQNWLDMHCRDVLDECDFTLSVKTQLNYPSGSEMAVDFHPYRWQVAQELLGLVCGHLRELQRQHPRGLQITSRGEHFPFVQFLRAESENALHDLILDDICSGRLTFLRPVHPKYRQNQSAVRKVLCAAKVTDKGLGNVASLFDNPKIAGNALLLVRGLLLHKIIILCLSKRWNVQYGLHPDRDPIAVPYEAKGKPSEQAEYGHPDVAILFTCLSFYYAGLTQAQLVQVVQHILQSNDPAAQYECLTSTCTELPVSLRRWSVINTEDKSQMEQLWKYLRKNRIAINYYLNHFVFPVHARQFEVKLQACSWDIPICLDKQTRLTRTTGFSGTNDNRLLLPLTISQRDLPELQHTSAEVLSYLLQDRNRKFHTIVHSQPDKTKEECFLRDLKMNGVSVLIDAGAYISEMSNEELAQTWLDVDPDAKAVIYFRNDNRPWVRYRSNAKEDVPLLATPLAEDMSECKVFLDEGHTRGVDLRLPTHACGAVTLALKLTKDHTVQAAMRLRQLQTTQSVIFYGPPAVESSIRDLHKLGPFNTVNSSHVVSWLLEQTCRSIEDFQGLYVAQGVDFCQRTDAVWNSKNFMSKVSDRQKLLCVLKQPERKTLKQLYGPVSENSMEELKNNLTSLQLRSFMENLTHSGQDQQGRIQAGALEEVEQEREVEVQVEQVRQVEKRKRYAALTFPGTHPEILRFAQSGTLEALRPAKAQKPGFEHAFAFVGRTAIGKRYHVHESSSRLFVSKEFSNTVQLARNSDEADNFLRPVEWILWSPTTETALVVIPEEAECLLEFLRGKQGKPHTYLITYAAPVTKAMIHLNKLDFYSYPELPEGCTVPERIRIELGILAGRLYVDKDEWKGLAEYVKGTNNLDKIAADTAAFVLEWLTLRRKAVNVLHTHMGYICTGREMDSAEDADSTV